MSATPGGGSTIVGAANRTLLIGVASEFRDYVGGGPNQSPDASPGGPELTSISPTTAQINSGNKTITLTGSRFVKGYHTTAKVGSETLPLTVVSDTSATVVVSSVGKTAGAATVSVPKAGKTATFTWTT